MIRSALPLRKTSLRHTPLHARTGRVAGRSARQRSAERELARTKRLVWARCGGRCEMCGAVLDPNGWEASHRRHDGMGGQGAANQRPSNILASCPGPLGCNQRLEWDNDHRSAGRTLGWLLNRCHDPAAVPVWRYTRASGLREPVFLTDDGGYREAS